MLKADHQVFAHVVVEQPADQSASGGARLPGALVGNGGEFALTLATLVQVCGLWCVVCGASPSSSRTPTRRRQQPLLHTANTNNLNHDTKQPHQTPN